MYFIRNRGKKKYIQTEKVFEIMYNLYNAQEQPTYTFGCEIRFIFLCDYQGKMETGSTSLCILV